MPEPHRERAQQFLDAVADDREDAPHALPYESVVEHLLAATAHAVLAVADALDRLAPERDLAASKPQDLAARSEAFVLDPDKAYRMRPTRYGPQEYALIRDLLIRCAATPGASARAALMEGWGVTASTADRLIAKTREQFPDVPRAARGPKPRPDA